MTLAETTPKRERERERERWEDFVSVHTSTEKWPHDRASSPDNVPLYFVSMARSRMSLVIHQVTARVNVIND